MSGPELRRHFALEELAPGVHAAIATPDGFGLCNAAIVDLGGSTLVFDAMLTPEAGVALGREAERLTGRPVDLLVDSHYHGDHVRGNAAIGPAHVVSSGKVRELVLTRAREALEEDRRELPQELARLRSGEVAASPLDLAVLESWCDGVLATPSGWAIRPPDLTWEGELTVHGTERTARILTFGGGHSPSDVFVYLPSERLVFLGDLLSCGFHPCLWDGDLGTLATILGRVRALGIDRALPGHGPVCTEGGIVTMERYLAVLEARARERSRAGIPAERADPAPLPEPFDTWGFASFFAQNLSFAQRTLDARRPRAAGLRPSTGRS